MADALKAVDSARKVFSKRGGMLRTVDALRLGIHPRTLYELRDRGELERVGRGLYRLATAPHLTNICCRRVSGQRIRLLFLHHR